MRGIVRGRVRSGNGEKSEMHNYRDKVRVNWRQVTKEKERRDRQRVTERDREREREREGEGERKGEKWGYKKRCFQPKVRYLSTTSR